MEQFARWMKLEKRWMASYRKKMLKTTVFVTLPLTALVLGGLMAATSLMYGGFSQETVGLFLTGAAAGAFLVGLFILCLLPGLSAGRLKRGLRKAAKQMQLTETETDRMAEELLAAAADPAAHFDFVVSGPNSKNTPASFYATPHYAYLRGGYPLVNIVRLADMGAVRLEQEHKTAATVRAKSSTITGFTLYTICFYSHERVSAGLAANTPADAAMGFFSEEFRDRAFGMLEAQKGRMEYDS